MIMITTAAASYMRKIDHNCGSLQGSTRRDCHFFAEESESRKIKSEKEIQIILNSKIITAPKDASMAFNRYFVYTTKDLNIPKVGCNKVPAELPSNKYQKIYFSRVFESQV